MKRISVRQVLQLISVRGLGVLLQVLLQFAIARLGGASALGLMQIYQTWMCVMGETTAMGLPTQTMKSVSTDRQGHVIVSRIMNSLKLIFLFWIVISTALLTCSWVFPDLIVLSQGNQLALTWSVLCFAALRVSAEALKAMDYSGKAIFSENSITPLMILCLCVLMIALGLKPTSQIMGVMSIGETLIYAASLFLTIAMIYSLFTCLHVCQKECLQGAHHKFTQANSHCTDDLTHQKALFSNETQFFWGTAILSIGFLNLPFLLMPWFGSIQEVGLFALAFKCINPISTILIMLGAIFGPRFAQAFSDRKHSKSLGTLLMQSQFISIGLYFPVLLPILFFAEPVLALFGEEFREAKVYLFILAIVQLINALTGLSGNMLNMIGLGKVEFQGSLIFAVLAVISGIWAGSFYGLEGIAISYSASLAGKNLWSYFFALRACHRNDIHHSESFELKVKIA